MAMGDYSLDVALLSDVQKYDPTYKSKARVLIKRVSLEGSESGGAVDCEACPAGLVSKGYQSYCTQCPPGHYPNEDQSECIMCPYGSFNPDNSGVCQECPMYTESDKSRTKCTPYDVITDELHN